MPLDTTVIAPSAPPTAGELREAVRAVLAVYEDAEREHYESDPHPEHVYLHLLTLKRFH